MKIKAFYCGGTLFKRIVDPFFSQDLRIVHLKPLYPSVFKITDHIIITQQIHFIIFLFGGLPWEFYQWLKFLDFPHENLLNATTLNFNLFYRKRENNSLHSKSQMMIRVDAAYIFIDSKCPFLPLCFCNFSW